MLFTVYIYLMSKRPTSESSKVPQCEMNTALYIKVSYGISFYLIISQNVHNKLKMLPNQVAYLPAIFCCCQ